MSRKTLLAWLSSLVMGLVFAPAAHAQHVTPFIEPNYFNPDFQFFAPADVTVYDDAPEAPIGWFFCYDRAFMNVSRASTQFRSWEGDETWGNRFELGYMTNDDKGWLATIWHIDGPSIIEQFTPPGVNSLADQGSATLTSVELNKTWRKHLHNGMILEPMIGFRYADYSEYYAVQDVIVAGGAVTNRITTARFVQNNIFGGVIGMRLAKQTGHWNLSGDFRISAGPNFQYYLTQSVNTPTGAGLSLTSSGSDNENQFTIVGTVRADAAYQLTRDAALHFGLELQDYGKGLGRVQEARSFGDHLLAVGMTMGFSINR